MNTQLTGEDCPENERWVAEITEAYREPLGLAGIFDGMNMYRTRYTALRIDEKAPGEGESANDVDILRSYHISPEDVFVIPFQNPLSSHMWDINTPEMSDGTRWKACVKCWEYDFPLSRKMLGSNKKRERSYCAFVLFFGLHC